jgi:hypothetical protein
MCIQFTPFYSHKLSKLIKVSIKYSSRPSNTHLHYDENHAKLVVFLEQNEIFRIIKTC